MICQMLRRMTLPLQYVIELISIKVIELICNQSTNIRAKNTESRINVDL